mgnify:CR=1 FL=1
MKVTIIVPVYNVSAYVERCWESLVKQTYKEIEILFVDDCGTDDSVEKLQKLIDTHPGIYCKILQKRLYLTIRHLYLNSYQLYQSNNLLV